MENNLPGTHAAPGPRARRLVTVFLLFHCFAILTAVTSYSTSEFPAPALALGANRPLRPYLHLTFLNHAYRFFAPNPGVPTVQWFRVQYQDGSVRWVESPARADSWLRMSYMRRLTVALALPQFVQPVPGDQGRRQFTDFGQICLASYARHVARSPARIDSHGSPVAVKSVGVYCVQHAPLSPEQVRAGWERIDLRTYQATFVGAFTPDGGRIDEFRPNLVDRPISQVAAGILEVDLYPLLLKHPERDRLQVASDLRLPAPVHRLLTRCPELLSPPPTEVPLPERIEQLVAAAPRPHADR
jgi:hypothetical protein